jgi:Tfp pilus assembly protein PilF
MADALVEIDAPSVAVQVLLRAGDANPTAPHLACRLAGAYLAAEDPEQAGVLSQRAVTQEPRCERAHVAFALARREETETAVRHLRTAHEIAPRDTSILLHLGRILAHKHQTAEATEVLEKLGELAPLDAETHYLRGVVLSEKPADGEAVRQAEHHLREALRVEPERWDARLQLGVLFSLQRQWARAKPLLEEARRRNPYSSATLHRLATVYRQLRDPRATKLWDELRRLEANVARWQQLQRRLTGRPDDLPLMLDAAELSLAVGAPEAAERLARDALDRDAQNERARLVLDKLQQPAAPTHGN